MKNSKLLIVLLSVLLVSLCGCDEDRDKAQELVSDGGYAGGMALPSDATDKKYIGNGWFTFRLYGECFMYADKNRSSTLARVGCKAH